MSKIITLTDPITGESVYPITSAETVISSSGSTVESALGKLEEDKQDKITDLEDIRNKANSAVQSEDLADVAFSGSYNDLSNKPAIPDAITEEDVAGWGFTKNTGTITEIKMNGSSKGTSGSVNLGNIVTKVKINGSEKTPTSGVVDLGTVITEHQDISGKLDKTEAADTYLTKTDASNTYLGKTAKAASATKADSATKATQDGNGNTITTTYATKTELNNKVDKDGNKQLSEEDFTLALKQKLEGLNNYDDTEISETINQLRKDFDELVDGDSSTAIKTFNEIIAFLEGIKDSEDLSSIISAIEQQIAAKQDKINDLDDIRTGAAKGKTSVQKVKINGTEKTPNTSGVVDLGTVITSHQDISGKLDKTEAASTYLTKTDASNTYLGKNDKAASASTADKATQDGNGNTITATYATKTELNNKVDKVSGKGLSTNDFTNEDKRLLGTIEEGAKVNVQSDWNETDEASDAFIKNKPVIPEIPNIPDNILGSVDIDEFIDDSSLGEYATKGYVDDSIRDAEENFATKDYVDEALSNIKLPEAETGELIVAMLSNQDNDETIAAIEALVKYDGKTVKVSNGGSISIPVNAVVTVEFPKVDGYNIPEKSELTVKSGKNNVSGTYTTTIVTVNVSAEDGSSVDGQVVTIEKSITIDCTPDYARIDSLGVAIMDIYGKFYKDGDEWIEAGRPTPNGVAVSDGIHRFCISPNITSIPDTIEDITLSLENISRYGFSDIEYPPQLGADTVEQAKKKFNGSIAFFSGIFDLGIETEEDLDLLLPELSQELGIELNSIDDIFTVVWKEILGTLVTTWPLGSLLSFFSILQLYSILHIFPNGKYGYLGSAGEWSIVANSINVVDSLMGIINGRPLRNSVEDFYWTSTIFDEEKLWACAIKDGYTIDLDTSEIIEYSKGDLIPLVIAELKGHRAFCSIKPRISTESTSENCVIVNGKAVFKSPIGATNTISFNDVNGYSSPSQQIVISEGESKSISAEYITYTEPVTEFTVEEAPDGVWILKKDGMLTYPRYAVYDSENSIVIVSGDQRFMIAEKDAEYDDGESGSKVYFEWGPCIDFPTIENITSNAILDFNGRSNTEALCENITSDWHMAHSLVKFNEGDSEYNGDRNKGFSDWYIPSCGQLALISYYLNDINNAMEYVSTYYLQEDRLYWSSSEYDDNDAWLVRMSAGSKSTTYSSKSEEISYVRFIRDL